MGKISRFLASGPAMVLYTVIGSLCFLLVGYVIIKTILTKGAEKVGNTFERKIPSPIKHVVRESIGILRGGGGGNINNNFSKYYIIIIFFIFIVYNEY